MIGCSRNFHKRCVSDLPDNCSPMARKISDVAGSQDDDVNIIDICFLLNFEGIISNTREVPETEIVVLCQFLFFY